MIIGYALEWLADSAFKVSGLAEPAPEARCWYDQMTAAQVGGGRWKPSPSVTLASVLFIPQVCLLRKRKVAMSQETFDYSAMLADARAKRAALDTFITSLENAQAMGALGQTGSTTAGGFTS